MNTNENTTAQNSSEDAPKVTHLEAGDRLAIHVSSFRGGLKPLPSNFMAHSVAAYAESYNEDPDAAVERAKGFGHDLYFFVAEGVIISARPMPVVQRIPLALGDLVEMDGHIFTIKESNNGNIKLVEVKADEKA